MSVYEAGASDASSLIAIKDSVGKKSLVKKRGVKRQSVTKAINKLSDGSCNTVADIKFLVQKLNGLMGEIIQLDNEIESHGRHARQSELAEHYLDLIQKTLIGLDYKLNNLTTPELQEPTNSCSNPLTKLKLPEVPFPVFDVKP